MSSPLLWPSFQSAAPPPSSYKQPSIYLHYPLPCAPYRFRQGPLRTLQLERVEEYHSVSPRAWHHTAYVAHTTGASYIILHDMPKKAPHKGQKRTKSQQHGFTQGQPDTHEHVGHLSPSQTACAHTHRSPSDTPGPDHGWPKRIRRNTLPSANSATAINTTPPASTR